MTKANDNLIERCKKGLERALEREANARNLWKEDLRFANADPDNGYQWPVELRKAREAEKRPCLTINKVKQHNRQITNDERQNKPSVRVKPVDDKADKKTAEIFNGIIRHIEANSDADTAYDTAAEHAVDAGLGYWRVMTDYCDPRSFDQDIFIKRVKNPLNIVLGPHNEADGSDCRQAWVFEDLPKDKFESENPDAEPINWDSNAGDGWQTKDTIRVCEFYEITDEKDTLIADENGNTMLLSEMEPDIAKAVKARKDLRKRAVLTPKLTWYKLAGDGQELDKRDLLGKYIPIVKVVGEEIEIDGEIDRKGHTRGMKDAQRMYNYNSSANVEYGALQTKVPWVAPVEATAGYEAYWDTANTANHSRLPYNSYDEEGRAIPQPQRPAPPTPAMLYIEGMRIASEEMKMTSGQYDASMGAKSNETSGRAIMARQREGDVATFHFTDNLSRAIKYTGKILIDLIPKIYDTPRVVRILGEDGEDDRAQVDPSMPEAYREEKGQDGAIQKIFNPTVGKYDVTVSAGPSYTTRREEAAMNMVEMARGNPNMWQTHGDLIVKSQDWPMADEFAKRSEKLLPPELRDEKEGEPQIPPQVQAQMEQMQQQVQQYEGALQKALDEVEALESDKDAKAAEIEVKRVEANTKAYDAVTKRLQVLGPLLNPVEVQQLAAETQREAMEQPDPGMAPAESMGVPEMPEEIPPDPMTQEQPQAADAAFFTPK